MKFIENPRIQQALNVATIAGGSVVVLNAAMELTKVKTLRSAAMPIVSLLVGVAAFAYATGRPSVILKKA